MEKFFYNLLSDSTYELKNRHMHVDYISNNKCDNSIKAYSFEEQAIINMIRNNPNITQENIADKLNKSIRTIKTIMAGMKKRNIIKRENSKKTGYWVVTK